MIKVRYKGEIEIALDIPDDTQGLVPFEAIQEEINGFSSRIRGVILSELVDTDYGDAIVKTISASVYREGDQ